MTTIPEIEDAMADCILSEGYPAVIAEYHRLLGIMGNVDGDEIVALVMVAIKRTTQ
jgi:hypothetical protein